MEQIQRSMVRSKQGDAQFCQALCSGEPTLSAWSPCHPEYQDTLQGRTLALDLMQYDSGMSLCRGLIPGAVE